MAHTMRFTSLHTPMSKVQYHIDTVPHNIWDDKIQDYEENLWWVKCRSVVRFMLD